MGEGLVGSQFSLASINWSTDSLLLYYQRKLTGLNPLLSPSLSIIIPPPYRTMPLYSLWISLCCTCIIHDLITISPGKRDASPFSILWMVFFWGGGIMYCYMRRYLWYSYNGGKWIWGRKKVGFKWFNRLLLRRRVAPRFVSVLNLEHVSEK